MGTSFFDVNQTGLGSEVLNDLYQRFFWPLRDSQIRPSKREKTSGIQGTLSSYRINSIFPGSILREEAVFFFVTSGCRLWLKNELKLRGMHLASQAYH